MAKSSGKVVVIDRDCIESPALAALTGKAPHVLLMFLGKRRVERLRRAGKRGERWKVSNNGQITFTYREAARRGITACRFGHALDQLIEVGFIDQTRRGNGLERDATLYGLSNRWRTYGTPQFVATPRPKGRPWVKKNAQEPPAESRQENLHETAQENQRCQAEPTQENQRCGAPDSASDSAGKPTPSIDTPVAGGGAPEASASRQTATVGGDEERPASVEEQRAAFALIASLAGRREAMPAGDVEARKAELYGQVKALTGGAV